MSIVVGSVGAQVETVQSGLNAAGIQPRLVVDGMFGPDTVAAIARFQTAAGLPSHGVVDALTATALGLDVLVDTGVAAPLGFEAIIAALLGELRLPLAVSDIQGMSARRQRLRVLFTSVPAADGPQLRHRLSDPADPLGAEFQGELHSATIAELLGLLPTGVAAPLDIVLELTIADSPATAGHYFTWAPVPCQLRVVDPAGSVGTIAVRVRNSTTAAGGELTFRAGDAMPTVDELDLDLDAAGAPSAFQIVPAFGAPSSDDGDAGIAVVVAGDAAPTLHATAMIRVRKNANTLSVGERDRFLAAFALLNDSGNGAFEDFRDMHVAISDDEAHGFAGFLPWHRAYLLDLERELQALDPSVTIPYWRFDQAAPNVFSPEFMGRRGVGLQPVLSPTNPLNSWVTDGQAGIVRRARFDDQLESAPGRPTFPVFDQAQTLAWGDTFGAFRRMEGTPHGAAHVSFDGSISSVPTAAKDPLFFMLHANIDRLWALWQFVHQRYESTDPAAYPDANSAGAVRVGHRRDDTMWPWNDVRTPPRPVIAPRTPLATSPVTVAPGAAPTVGQMIDYQGQVAARNWLAFGYDDVPFDL